MSSNLIRSTNSPVREQVKHAVLETAVCGFESRPGYHLLCRLTDRTTDFGTVDLSSNLNKEAIENKLRIRSFLLQ